MLDAVCFDLDGTLFDDRQYVRGGLRHAARVLERETGIDCADALRTAYFDRDIREATFDVVLAEYGLSRDRVPELVEAYHDNTAGLTPYPGAESALSTLAGRYPLALITGGRNGREKLRRLSLADYFETVLVTSRLDCSKRDPDPFERALETLGVAPDAAAYVGDRPELDFPQPNRLGMTTVRVETGRYADADATGTARPDGTVPTVADVPERLSALETQK